MNKLFNILCIIAIAGLFSCNDDDTFSASTANLLTMDCDTVKFGTVFTKTPTAAQYFWVRNNTNDGIRCSSIRLNRGNQSGYRVNVDGTYLGSESGYKTSNVEIRKGDSIRVFVELTASKNYTDGKQVREDDIVFMLESGVQQKVNLNAMTWDADTVHNMHVTSDMCIDTNNRPLIIYGGITVDSTATLTIAKGSTLYFYDTAGIDVYGKLICDGDSTTNVTLRGYRLDNMFDYLPYDMLPGHWKGIRFHSTSYGNEINYTDIHSTYDGIVCDSSDVNITKLTLANSIVHNCQGYGLYIQEAKVNIFNTQLTNTLNSTLAIYGGDITVLHTTIGQFYPLTSYRGDALYISNLINGHGTNLNFMMANSIVTGYADDVIMGEQMSDSLGFTYNYLFANCLLRTPAVDDSVHYRNVIWEHPDSTVNGEKQFVKVDLDSLRFDFHLDTLSTARKAGNPLYLIKTNREGLMRDENNPDLGCY